MKKKAKKLLNILRSFSILDFFSNLWFFLLKLICYSPLLWKDRDWDYYYILRLLQYKLKRTRKCLQKENILADLEQTTKRIRTAELLIDRICKDDYCEKEFSEHWFKWNLERDFERCKRRKLTGAEQVQERRESRQIIDRINYLEKQDMDYLFKHLRKYLKTWWD